MISSRGLRRGTLAIAGAVIAALALPARSQRTGSGSEAPTPAEPESDDEGAAAGSAGPLVAPQDPKARVAWLRDRLAAAIASRPALAKAQIAFAVQDLATGQDLVSREPDRGMTIASNAKLLTSVAALLGLGSGFRWRTAVFAKPPDDKGVVEGDLYLRGRGDPTLSAAALQKLAADVAARGVREIEGRLVVDATYFDGVIEPPHFDEQPKERAAFRAPVASLGMNRGAIAIRVAPEPGGGDPRVLLDPPCECARLAKTEVTSADKGRTRLRVEQRTKGGVIEYDVTGQIRASDGTWEVRRRFDDPARLAAEVFRRALADEGVRLRTRGIGSGTVPLTLRLLAHHDSATLADVLRLVNKHSDNYIAESVLKTLGAETKGTPGPATWADGTAALAVQLAKLGLPPGSYRSDNGSGLFASSEVSARQLLVLLAAAHRDYRVGPDLVASLPIGGQDGTLARRWAGRPAQGRVRAKTGTLDKVSSLAGYVGVDGGHLLAFAILTNDIPAGQRAVIRAMVDEMVDALAAYLGAT
ncbi:MAG TPA: D-alanyl-D-alanine carboxypeptidase/D-alanyl-D-alanine-endopeptidase [Kofleriaceae bacterium]|nr:D-alanyl-D-alanine carboxypeptidase/D-alanyl-D-alanine-endopeptidase [Kofleriaceae bacterium]